MTVLHTGPGVPPTAGSKRMAASFVGQMAYVRQVRFVADLSVRADSDRAFRLPAQARSMLVRLEGPPDQMFGVVITNPAGAGFEPGVEVASAVLEPWADPVDLPLIEPGLSFILWYGCDVGAGTVSTVSP